MSKFWPSDIKISDTQSPKEILKVAQEDWSTSSDGVMELVLQDATSEAGNAMIIIYAKHVPTNRTSTLLSVVHRPNNPYPVTIQPTVEDLPDFLKKSYNQPGLQNFEGIIPTGRTVSNEWVSDTPSEFRDKLAKAFNLGAIKSKILNLASSSSNVLDDTNKIVEEDSTEND